MAIVKRVKEYYQEKPSRINQEDYGIIINLTVCDRCKRDKPSENSANGRMEAVVWISHPGNIDICPDCLTESELEEANYNIKKELNVVSNAVKKLNLKKNWINSEIENWFENKEFIERFQQNFNKKYARR
ncbi:hypothetical protein [Desulfonema limicola]|uniref:hypothetical protein n=1 Tax=Desulfonema limicola TaxID=45656 RepID=UPI001A9BA7C5|nr:hypothetical protein [Desulfonema limicola]